VIATQGEHAMFYCVCTFSYEGDRCETGRGIVGNTHCILSWFYVTLASKLRNCVDDFFLVKFAFVCYPYTLIIISKS